MKAITDMLEECGQNAQEDQDYEENGDVLEFAPYEESD